MLVNGSTSHTGELFAVSLREFGKGKVVGTQTAGKGTIQCTPVTLSDGSAISYTVGILLDKEGNSFDGTGITPDVEIAPEGRRRGQLHFSHRGDGTPDQQSLRGSDRHGLQPVGSKQGCGVFRQHACRVTNIHSAPPLPGGAFSEKEPTLNLTDLATVKDLCARHGFQLSKGFGQNFIVNPGVCPKMVESAGIDRTWGVVEIGRASACSPKSWLCGRARWWPSRWTTAFRPCWTRPWPAWTTCGWSWATC